MRILFLKGQSRNDVLRIFIDRLASAFSTIDNVSVTISDALNGYNKPSDFVLLVKNHDVIFSFNTTKDVVVTMNGDGSQCSLFDIVPIKQVFWLVDDPVYHIAQLSVPHPNRLTIFTSELHLHTAKALGLTGSFLQNLSAGQVNLEMKPHHLRKYDVAIAASWMGEEQDFWHSYQAPLRQIVEQTIECMNKSVVCNAYPIFSKLLLAEDLVLTDTQLQIILAAIHSYIRKKDRIYMIKKLVDTHLSVVLIGSGWRNLFSDADNVSYIEDIGYEEINNIYENAKVVVNLNAENGASERVFNGIECGSMIFSDFSNALYRIFSYDNGVVFYQRIYSDASIAQLVTLIEQEQTEILARKSQKIVADGHTWEHRAKWLYSHLLSTP